MVKDLIKQSDKFKVQANDLLGKSELLQLLENNGRVVVTGSFSYDLMLSPDIDIYVLTDKLETVATTTLDELLKQRFWNGYLFYDWFHFRSDKHPEFPKSYYVGLKTTSEQQRWKVDIWFLDNDAYHDKEHDWITAKLTLETKTIILKLKYERNRSGAGINSYQIYDAVLNHGVTELKDVLTKLSDK